MSTDSYATSSASESQEPEIGGEMMVVEGSFKYKSWLWEHFTCVTSGSKREKHPPAKCRTCGKVVNRAGGSASRKTSQDHFFYATINTSGNSIVFSDFVLCCMFRNVCVCMYVLTLLHLHCLSWIYIISIVDRGPTVGPTDGHGPGLFDLCTVAVRSRSGYLGLTAVHGPLKSSGPRQHC